VREKTQLPVQRNDFKLDMLPPHLFMNFRVVDEHGRQLGPGATWRAEGRTGRQARGAFQALAALKAGAAASAAAGDADTAACAKQPNRRDQTVGAASAAAPAGLPASATPPGPSASCPS
jgi:ATP-dependent helicase HrpA